jgi:glycerophosphoryl diester phosphodiesterase
MEVIAHRAGNSVQKLTTVERSVDLVEIDLHLGRGGRIEVRHAKSLWPTKRLWEKWYLLPRAAHVPELAEILDAAQHDTTFWFDLKGPDPRLAHALVTAAGDRRPYTVSTKPWWLLTPFQNLDGVRTVRSAGNRFELALLLWLPSRTKVDGSVVHHRLLTASMAKRLLRRGPVFSWGAQDGATVRALVEVGVNGVILDDIALAPTR